MIKFAICTKLTKFAPLNTNKCTFMDKKLDPTDIDILRVLCGDARLSVREVASRVHRSPTPVFERIKRLESSGVIRGYSADIDLDRLGRGFTVFCNVKLRRINRECHLSFTGAVKEMDEVTECYNVSGAIDYLLKVQVPDMEAYRIFITERLGRLDTVDGVQSMFVMEAIKQNGPLL